MKIPNKCHFQTALAFAAVLLSANVASAQVINFDVPGGVSGFTNFSGQGASADSGKNFWNAIVVNGTTSSCKLDDGSTTSPITLTVSSDSVYTAGGQGTQGTPSGLQSPFYDSKPGPKTCTLANVPAGTYNLYLYGINGDSADCNRGTTFTVGSSSLSTVNTTAAYNTFIQGNDYVIFSNVVVGSGGGSIVFTYQANTSVLVGGVANAIGNFNGLQLVTASGGGGSSVGATTPFTTYEAEAGTLGGGASIVALTAPPTTKFSSPQLEASGHAYVQLTGTGQSVTWTNNTGKNITAVNIRNCIPDSSGGGGINSTIDLYVNGTLRQAVPVSSTQTWVYETSSDYNGMSQTPSAGTPHVFWDESRTFITGAAVAPGSTIMLKKDSANSAAFYYIDCIDLEAPPAALSQPANTLSIASYGAQANNSSFDNTSAIQNCINAAQSQGKAVWIPSGTFYVSSGSAFSATGITIEGAGPWYSTIFDTSNSWSNGFLFNVTSTSFQNLCIDASKPDATPGMAAFLAYGDNWTINNVWARHTMLTWATGNNITIENSRVNNSWGDGLNINNTNGTACSNVTITNNFSRGNGDDGIALNSSNQSAPVMTNITITNNTCVASWWANEMGIYGGTNDIVENNLLQDSVKLNGLEVGVFGNGNGGSGDFMNSALVKGNLVVRGGSFGYGDKNPGISLGGTGQWTDPVVKDAVLSSNTVDDAMFDGIDIFTGTGMVVQYNTVNAPGLNGIGVGGGNGNATIIDNTVTNLKSGQVAFLNNDSSFTTTTGTPASSYNSENSVQTENCAEGGLDVGYLSNGSYTEYNSVNLNGATVFNARTASPNSGDTIAIHLDSPTGTVIGTCSVPNTGGFQDWTTTSCNLSGASGTHNVYLVYSGGFNIEWFTF